MEEKNFVFIRHARGNHQKEFYLPENKKFLEDTVGTAADNPFIADTGLSIEGHEQATLFGNYFRLIGEDQRYQNVFCSPIRRCIETCDHIVKEKNVILDDLLMEVNTIQHCNNKHTKEYLEKFLLVKSNRYNLDNIHNDYNPDRFTVLKVHNKSEYKDFEKTLQGNLQEIFGTFVDRVATIEESGEKKIEITEVIALHRIYQFIEKIFVSSISNPLVFTHGEWIQCLSKLYLGKTITRPLNCEVFKLTLRRLEPMLVKAINDAVKFINESLERRISQIREEEKTMSLRRTNLVTQTDYFKKYLKYKKRYLKIEN